MEITVTYHCPRAFLKPYIFSDNKNDTFCHKSLKLLALSTYPTVPSHLSFRTQLPYFYSQQPQPSGCEFTPLEMMPRCFAVPPAAGLGPRIVPAGFDASLKFLMGLTHPKALTYHFDYELWADREI
jgi:hypothetical protein